MRKLIPFLIVLFLSLLLMTSCRTKIAQDEPNIEIIEAIVVEIPEPKLQEEPKEEEQPTSAIVVVSKEESEKTADPIINEQSKNTEIQEDEVLIAEAVPAEIKEEEVKTEEVMVPVVEEVPAEEWIIVKVAEEEPKEDIVTVPVILEEAEQAFTENTEVTCFSGKGSYSTLTKKDASLLWEISLDYDGDLKVVLKEDGANKRLTTLPSSDAKYEVRICWSSEEETITNCLVLKNEGVYNCVFVPIKQGLIKYLRNDEMSIIITGYGAEYNLGTIDISSLKNLLSPDNSGSAGGVVFYDKGYYSDGWRYLEAAPARLKVIDGIPSVDQYAPGWQLADDGYPFGYYGKSSYGGNLYVNGTSTFKANNCTSLEVGTGQKNTKLLVNAMKDEAFNEKWSDSVTWYYAAKLCDDLIYEVDGKRFDDWFLPSREELKLLINEIGEKRLSQLCYWSSSEWGFSYHSDPSYAWMVSKYGIDNGEERDKKLGIIPVRAF